MQSVLTGYTWATLQCSDYPVHPQPFNLMIFAGRKLQIWVEQTNIPDICCRYGIRYKSAMAFFAGSMHKQPTSRIMSSRLYPKNFRRKFSSPCTKVSLEVTCGYIRHLKERFYWPSHFEDVRNWCQTCAVCASRKTPSPTSQAPLTTIKTGYPLQIVAMDIMRLFPPSSQVNRCIIVVSHYFTLWVEAFGIPDQLATTVCFGLPEQLYSDLGHDFESHEISKIYRLLEIVKTRTPLYHPQSDSLVERVNLALLGMMAMATSNHPNQWGVISEASAWHITAGYKTEETSRLLPQSDLNPRQISHWPLDLHSPTCYVVLFPCIAHPLHSHTIKAPC